MKEASWDPVARDDNRTKSKDSPKNEKRLDPPGRSVNRTFVGHLSVFPITLYYNVPDSFTKIRKYSLFYSRVSSTPPES